MIISELFNIFLDLPDKTGLSLAAMIFIFSVVLLILVAGFAILLNLRSTGNLLVDAGYELETLAQNLELQSSNKILALNLRSMSADVSDRFELGSELEQGDDTRKAQPKSLKGADGNGNTLAGLKGRLTLGKAETIRIKSEEYTASLLSNSDLRKWILDLICDTDQSVSLQYLVKHLPRHYFDGNYHPVLNELDRLEKEGEIEGRAVNGKAYFSKRRNETRKYIIRKGRNFRRYMG